MRVASRIIGSVLVLCGLGLFCIFGYISVTEGWPTGRRVWPLGAFFILGGLGLMLAGRYYLRLDPDTLDHVRPVSILGRFMIFHRSQLSVLAQAGAVISLIYFGMACFGQEWPGRWFLWPLGAGAVALQSIARKIADPAAGEALGWSRVPMWMRNVLEPAKKAAQVAIFALMLLMLLILWNQFSGHLLRDTIVYRFASWIVVTGCVAILYVFEALFFLYGEIRRDSEGG